MLSSNMVPQSLSVAFTALEKQRMQFWLELEKCKDYRYGQFKTDPGDSSKDAKARDAIICNMHFAIQYLQMQQEEKSDMATPMWFLKMVHELSFGSNKKVVHAYDTIHMRYVSKLELLDYHTFTELRTYTFGVTEDAYEKWRQTLLMHYAECFALEHMSPVY